MATLSEVIAEGGGVFGHTAVVRTDVFPWEAVQLPSANLASFPNERRSGGLVTIIKKKIFIYLGIHIRLTKI